MPLGQATEGSAASREPVPTSAQNRDTIAARRFGELRIDDSTEGLGVTFVMKAAAPKSL
jgi:hypothetical protein